MASKETVFRIRGEFDIGSIAKNAEAASKALSQISAPDKVIKQLQKEFEDIKKTATDLAGRINQPFKNPKEIEKFNNDLEKLQQSLIGIQKTATDYQPDLSWIKNNSDNFKEFRRQINEAQDTIDNINKKHPIKINYSGFENSGKLVKQIGRARTEMNAAVKSGTTPERLQEIQTSYQNSSSTKAGLAYNKELSRIYTEQANKLDIVLKKQEAIISANQKINEGVQEEAQLRQQVVLNISTGKEKEIKETERLADSTAELNKEYEKEAERTQNVSQLSQRLKYMTSFVAVLNLARQTLRSIWNDIKELDQAFNEISVVTGKTMDQMWDGFGKVNKIAQEYGVTTKGVVEIQNLYYHQGLDDTQVNRLTAETLTLAKIASLDYAEATDKMTAALNAFNIEAQNAGRVTDVTAALASSAAASSDEIMNALTKTASISASAGTSLENTEIFLTKMIETTRESSENLGTALKTVTARFTELKSAVDENEDGEIADFNKVDTALKSVGISLKDSAGQIRDFDDIIYDLSAKWDTLDRNTQRYIATQAAGSRRIDCCPLLFAA